MLDLRRKRGVIVAAQPHRGTERYAHPPWPCHSRTRIEYPINAVDAHRDDRHVEPRRHHADPAAELVDLAGGEALAFGKDQRRPAVTRQLTGVAERLPRACLTLRKRKR